jgi:hypothetical protein
LEKGSGDQITIVYHIQDWSEEYAINFKINMAVLMLNCEKDMNERISKLQPFRWKCLQALSVHRENESDKQLRYVRELLISDEQFE